jgi:hypothetical protein
MGSLQSAVTDCARTFSSCVAMVTTSTSDQVAVLAGTCACYSGLIPCLDAIQCSLGPYIASQTRACQTSCAAGNVAATPCGSIPPSTVTAAAPSTAVATTLTPRATIPEQSGATGASETTGADTEATGADTETNAFGCSERTAAVVAQCDMRVSVCLQGEIVSQPSWCACFSEYASCLVGHEQCTIVATGIAAIRQSCTAALCPSTAFCATAEGQSAASAGSVTTVPRNDKQ